MLYIMSWIYGCNFSLSAWFASSFTGSSRSADGNGWRTAVLGLGLADKANKRTLGRNHLQKAGQLHQKCQLSLRLSGQQQLRTFSHTCEIPKQCAG